MLCDEEACFTDSCLLRFLNAPNERSQLGSLSAVFEFRGIIMKCTMSSRFTRQPGQKHLALPPIAYFFVVCFVCARVG